MCAGDVCRTAGWPFGAWRLALGAWRLALGAWRLALGAWRLALGAWRTGRIVRSAGIGRSRRGEPPAHDDAAPAGGFSPK
ncbi:hypothetical protein CFB39_31235 [Burkholderia sp. AU6039]|nr:hypothetical protein CFB39_31235 [Burkholderia sp. AU6039]